MQLIRSYVGPLNQIPGVLEEFGTTEWLENSKCFFLLLEADAPGPSALNAAGF